jgi:hypothetical protein
MLSSLFDVSIEGCDSRQYRCRGAACAVAASAFGAHAGLG